MKPLDAAVQVLKEAGEPLHVREIAQRSIEQGFLGKQWKDAWCHDRRANLGRCYTNPVGLRRERARWRLPCGGVQDGSIRPVWYYFDPAMGRLSALNEDETIILTHFRTDEAHIRGLPDSNYQ